MLFLDRTGEVGRYPELVTVIHGNAEHGYGSGMGYIDKGMFTDGGEERIILQGQIQTVGLAGDQHGAIIGEKYVGISFFGDGVEDLHGTHINGFADMKPPQLDHFFFLRGQGQQLIQKRGQFCGFDRLGEKAEVIIFQMLGLAKGDIVYGRAAKHKVAMSPGSLQTSGQLQTIAFGLHHIDEKNIIAGGKGHNGIYVSVGVNVVSLLITAAGLGLPVQQPLRLVSVCNIILTNRNMHDSLLAPCHAAALIGISLC